MNKIQKAYNVLKVIEQMQGKLDDEDFQELINTPMFKKYSKAIKNFSNEYRLPRQQRPKHRTDIYFNHPNRVPSEFDMVKYKVVDGRHYIGFVGDLLSDGFTFSMN